jgi:hypothetical protein
MVCCCASLVPKFDTTIRGLYAGDSRSVYEYFSNGTHRSPPRLPLLQLLSLLHAAGVFLDRILDGILRSNLSFES